MRPDIDVISRLYEKLIQDLESGSVDREALMVKSRLSKQAVDKYIGVRMPNALHIAHPKLNPLYLRLKMLVEKVFIENSDIAHIHEDLVAEVRDFIAGRDLSKTDISKMYPEGNRLYNLVNSYPYRSTIWRLSGVRGGNPDYWYWSDHELVEKAGQFDSFTQINNYDNNLRKHLLGRGLDLKVMSRFPKFVGIFYEGLNKFIYRSKPELYAGNFLVMNYIHFEKDFDSGCYRPGSAKPMTADFFFPEIGFAIELCQCTTRPDGKRRELYIEKLHEKQCIYKNNGFDVTFVDTDPYWDHGAFDISRFIDDFNQIIRSRGFDSSKPSSESVAFSNCEEKQKILNLSAPDLVFYLQSIGVNGLATLKNFHSHIYSLISIRRDSSEVLAMVKKVGENAKSRARSSFNAKRLASYSPLEKVLELCESYDIRSQSQWYEFAKNNKNLLALHRIPASLPSVYEKKGEWFGWGFIWPKSA